MDVDLGSTAAKIRVDLDSGAGANTVSFRFVRKHRLQPIPATLPGFVGVQGAPLKCHGTYQVMLHAQDRLGQQRVIHTLCYAIRREVGAPDFLLGHPTMAEEGIILYNTDQSWEFGITRVPSPESWAAPVADGSPAFQVQLTRAVIGNFLASHYQLGEREPQVTALDEEEELDAPLDPRLVAYPDVFSKRIARELPLLERAEHTIELEDGTKPPVGPLYPLSERQAQALQEYLRENIALGRITISEADAGSPVLLVPKKDGERSFLVKWAGWPAEYNTWEPEEHLSNASKLVNAYLKKKRKTYRK